LYYRRPQSTKRPQKVPKTVISPSDKRKERKFKSKNQKTGLLKSIKRKKTHKNPKRMVPPKARRLKSPLNESTHTKTIKNK
jgi:hypothetical protein